MTPITLVITRKEHGGMEIIPRTWDEDTCELNEPVMLKQHDKVSIFKAGPADPIVTTEPTHLTMRKHLTATAYDGASLYETET